MAGIISAEEGAEAALTACLVSPSAGGSADLMPIPSHLLRPFQVCTSILKACCLWITPGRPCCVQYCVVPSYCILSGTHAAT